MNKIFLMFKHRCLFPSFIKTIDIENLLIDVSTVNVLKILLIITT